MCWNPRHVRHVCLWMEHFDIPIVLSHGSLSILVCYIASLFLKTRFIFVENQCRIEEFIFSLVFFLLQHTFVVYIHCIQTSHCRPTSAHS